jgi:asparagine synthase (glutamine-hydrolysing)
MKSRFNFAQALPQAISLMRHMGPHWMLMRVRFAIQNKTRTMQRRLPAGSWQQHSLSRYLRDGIPSQSSEYANWSQMHRAKFLFRELPVADVLREVSRGTAVRQADALLGGEWIYFAELRMKVGFPPQWHRNPISGESPPSERHWADISDFAYGDIKLVWEASRFSCVYGLVRAYALTGDERYPESFWSLLESWAQNNPPQRGPNWKCGQEASFRLMAWCFGLYGFSQSLSSTAERVANLAGMIAVTAERVAAYIDYALSQNNNHGISEATGLFTAGALFPELRNAEAWRVLGRQLLELQARKQIYGDGAYVQHSMNYHRVMLHNYLWAMRLGEINGTPLSEALYERLLRSTEFLDAMTDPVSGRAPNYGNNDGTQVLPLTDCEYGDFRPTLQALYYLCSRQRRFAPGPWDEALVWLFGESALVSPMLPAKQHAISLSSGYYLMKGRESWAMIRCAEYRDRPAHADQLHLDLWWRGLNVAIDSGSYHYNARPPWDTAFSGSAAHNTVTVDRRDQMRRFSRFLWLDWAKGQQIKHEKDGESELWVGEHDGSRRLCVTHRREVERDEDSWTIRDKLFGRGEHTVRLHWLFADFAFDLDPGKGALRLKTPEGTVQIHISSSSPAWFSLVRSGENVAGAAPDEDVSTRGWVSPTYASKVPALSLVVQVSGKLPICFETTIEFAGGRERAHDLDTPTAEVRE